MPNQGSRETVSLSLFKPLQVKCFEYFLKGKDIVAVLPTGFGNSLLLHLLPDFLPVKVDNDDIG